MSEFDSKKALFEDDPIIFDLEDVISSGELVRTPARTEADVLELAKDRGKTDEAQKDPVFDELASIKLPELERENRARLQMQTPNRLFFYWSIKDNPFQTLRRAFGDTGSYSLVAKLIDLTRDTEAIYPVEAEGTFWFNVDSDREYRAEVGFYAPNRPYVRLMFSNTVTTPRKRPSRRAATSADWTVNARSFARVLDVSGFRRDAFEVAIAGDRPPEMHQGAHEAVAQFIQSDPSDFEGIASAELRYALMLIASGLPIEDLRYRIDASLFALLLQANVAGLSVENAATVLKEHFGVDPEEIVEEEEASNAVFGASLVNFPRPIKRKRPVSGYNPVSSFGTR